METAFLQIVTTYGIYMFSEVWGVNNSWASLGVGSIVMVQK